MWAWTISTQFLGTLRSHRAGNIVIVFVAVQTLCIVFSLLFPESFRYLSEANLQLLFRSIPQLAILVIGVNLLMITGEFDLSVGSNFTFSALIMAMALNLGVPGIATVILALFVGAFIGFSNGILTTQTGIPSFIATLGGMMFWRGMILLLSQGQTEPFRPGEFFEAFLVSSLGPFQAQFFWLIVVAVLAHMLLERHRLGNHFFAVGGNKESAIAVGVNANRVKIAAFILVGVLASFSGIMSTTRIHSVSPIQGEGLELQAIAACVIGGTRLMGGTGTVLGAVLGAALLYTIQDILLLLRAPGFYLQMFVGILIVVAVILNQLAKKK